MPYEDHFFRASRAGFRGQAFIGETDGFENTSRGFRIGSEQNLQLCALALYIMYGRHTAHGSNRDAQNAAKVLKGLRTRQRESMTEFRHARRSGVRDD